jgi:hypothetical protein
MKKTPDLLANADPEPLPAAPEVAATAPEVPTPVAATPAPAEAQRDAALEIAQTCTLAGRTDLIVGFLEAGLSAARVRHQLLAMQAEASPEIASRVAPVTSPYARPSADAADNPLLQAVKRRLAAH